MFPGRGSLWLQTMTELSDAELLRQFVTSRNESAFAMLIRRHGRLVWSICRRTTGEHHDAEDAFQAVFVVLARKAAEIERPALLGNWLFGVAQRIANRARQRAHKRHLRESAVAKSKQAEQPPDEGNDQLAWLDHELSRLPAHYREAILLCDLQELSRSEAAARLGIPEGTLSSRLAVGRKRLADRLRRRGVVVPVAGVGLLFQSPMSAEVPRELLSQTFEIALAEFHGSTVPAAIHALTIPGNPLMTKFLALSLVTLSLGLGTALAWSPATSDEGPTPPAVAKTKVPDPEKPDDKPKKDETKTTGRPKRIRFIRVPNTLEFDSWHPDGKHLFLEKDSRNVVVLPLDSQVMNSNQPGLRGQYSKSGNPDNESYLTFSIASSESVLGFQGAEPVIVSWLRMGGTINVESVLHFWQYQQIDKEGNTQYVGVRTPTRSLDLNSDDGVPQAISPDGKTLLMRATGLDQISTVRLIDINSAERIGDIFQTAAYRWFVFAFRPDSKELAVLSMPADAKEQDQSLKLTCYELPSGKELWSEVLSKVYKGPNSKIEVKYSPDGKKLMTNCFMSSQADELSERAKQREILTEKLWEKFAGDQDSIQLAGAEGVAFRAMLQRMKITLPEKETITRNEYLKIVDSIPTNKPLTEYRHRIQIHDAHTGQLIRKVGEEQHATWGYNFSHDSRLIVGVYSDPQIDEQSKLLRIWDASTGDVVHTWAGFAKAYFAPDRPTLLIAEHDPNSNNMILGLWDLSAILK